MEVVSTDPVAVGEKDENELEATSKCNIETEYDGHCEDTNEEAEPAISELAISEPATSEPAISEDVIFEAVISEPAISELAISELATPEPEISEPVTSELATSGGKSQKVSRKRFAFN